MPNPPKIDPVRGHRGRGPTKLPPEGRRGPAPDWPLAVQADGEAEAWAEVWATPQAVAWERLGWTRTVARYVRILVAAEQIGAKAALLAQVTALEDRLGLTPKSMRLLLWEITAEETKEKRQSRSTARDRIRAV